MMIRINSFGYQLIVVVDDDDDKHCFNNCESTEIEEIGRFFDSNVFFLFLKNFPISTLVGNFPPKKIVIGNFFFVSISILFLVFISKINQSGCC